MDIGLVRALITAILFVLFCALVFWSFSKHRAKDFEQAAALPLEEDNEQKPEKNL